MWYTYIQAGKLNTPKKIFKLIVVLVRVSIAAVKHYDQKASWGGKGLLGLHFSIVAHH